MWAPEFGPARLTQRRSPGPLSSSLSPLWPLLLLLLAAVAPVRAWESGDLELFDLVEEVQLNFYEFLGVQQVSARAAGPDLVAQPGPLDSQRFPSPSPTRQLTSGLSAKLDGATSLGVLIPLLWLSGDRPFPTPKDCAGGRRKGGRPFVH